MSVFSEFVVDGEQRDLYDKAALHDGSDVETALDSILGTNVKTKFDSLGANLGASNILSALFMFLGNTIGAAPSTLTTTSKTIVGAIKELKTNCTVLSNQITAEHNRIHISTTVPTASDGEDGDIWLVYNA